MSAATQDILTPKVGPEDQVLPSLFAFQVAANTIIYGGTMVAVNSSGYAVPASATAGLTIVGRAERQVNNLTSNSPYGGAGAQQVLVDRGAFYYNLNSDSTVTIANWGTPVYASDDNTVSTSDAGGTRPYAGYLVPDPTTPGIPGLLTTSVAGTKVAVQLPFTYGANSLPAATTAYKARAVMTNVGPYSGGGTGTLTVNAANTAIGTQDGVSTLAVGDVVFMYEGLTNINAASDAGPYVVNSIGATNNNAKWVLTRPDWWATGATIPLGQALDIGPEGTFWPDVSWKTFATKGNTVVDTNDLKFYQGRVTVPLTLVNSVATLSTVPILSATKTGIFAELVNAINATNTVNYGTNVAATPGAIGTATATIVALQTGMVKSNSNDNSQILVTVINW